MKLMKSASAFVAGALMLSLVPAVPAAAQVNSVDQLLQAVRQDAAAQRAENQQRIQQFQRRAAQQESLLAQARGELNQLNARANAIQGQFAANESQIDTLKTELQAAQGEFGDVFGAARRSAGEFRAMLDSSLITAQYPGRTEVLERVAESEALPTADELNSVFELMLEEMRAQREVATFQAPVANVADGAEQSVTRVGPFTAFTSDNANFLGYSAPTEGNPIALKLLPKQPADGAIRDAASRVVSANAGDVVFAPIDPTRGSLLESFERVPTVQERISYGKTIGYIIIGLLIAGLIFGIFNIIRLFMISASVKAQTRRAQPQKGNPLGRIMLAYEDSRDRDPETVELKMDEAILRESPKLERGLSLLKLGAAIAPLLGLLGTVTGMIQTFQAMMIYGTGDPQLMAGGISEALVTTMLGLIAAIPLLVLHAFCASIARGIQNTLEEQSAGIVARHVEARPVTVDATPGVDTRIV